MFTLEALILVVIVAEAAIGLYAWWRRRQERIHQVEKWTRILALITAGHRLEASLPAGESLAPMTAWVSSVNVWFEATNEFVKDECSTEAAMAFVLNDGIATVNYVGMASLAQGIEILQVRLRNLRNIMEPTGDLLLTWKGRAKREATEKAVR